MLTMRPVRWLSNSLNWHQKATTSLLLSILYNCSVNRLRSVQDSNADVPRSQIGAGPRSSPDSIYVECRAWSFRGPIYTAYNSKRPQSLIRDCPQRYNRPSLMRLAIPPTTKCYILTGRTNTSTFLLHEHGRDHSSASGRGRLASWRP